MLVLVIRIPLYKFINISLIVHILFDCKLLSLQALPVKTQVAQPMDIRLVNPMKMARWFTLAVTITP